MKVTPAQVEAGQAIYSQRTLAVYDLVVLRISNRWVWRCPTPRLEAHYNRHLSASHLDVGVGSGYFLDRCRFPRPAPSVTLMDLNPHSLHYAAKRIARYAPRTIRGNVLEPIPWDGERFDSIGVNYLLHCLPGAIDTKAVVFDHLKALLSPGGVLFGSTLLQGGIRRGWSARRLMAFYNAKGVFANQGDDLAGLTRAMEQRFADVSVEVVGCAALFSGRV